MNKLGRKIIAGALTISMLALTACSGGNTDSDSDTTSGTGATDKQTNTEASDGAKGRYLEEEIALPEEAMGILTMKQLDNGTIRVITYTGIYDSTDGGATFNYVEESAAIWGEDGYVQIADCSSSGEMVLQKTTYSETEEFYGYTTESIHVDSEFNVTSLEMNIPDVVLNETVDLSEFNMVSGGASEENSISGGGQTMVEEGMDGASESPQNTHFGSSEDMSTTVIGVFILPNDNYLVSTSMGELYQVDKGTGEVIAAYSDEEYLYASSYAVIDKQLIVFTSSSVSTFDFESGNVMDTDAVLANLISSSTLESGAVFAGGYGASVTITQDDEAIYYVNNEGIFRYTLGSDVTEEIANASLNSLSNPEYTLSSILKTDDNEFYVAVSTTSGALKLLKYTYSADALTTPSQEIKIYSLEDNDTIRQAISVYQKNNPDVYVSLEVGMPEGSAVTASDAIRTLNTNIVAGTGPDILILDGLPIDSYIEKDSLVDLTDIVTELNESEGIFENIVNTYAKDEHIYAIPSRFTVDLLVAKNDILQTYSDLNGLADAVAEYKAASEGNVINVATAETLVKRLYDTSSGLWANEDGTLDETTLTEFVTALEKIYQTIDVESSGETMQIAGNGINNTMSYAMELLMSAYPISLIPLSSVESLTYVTSIAEKLEDTGYTLLNGQTANSYIPMTTVGISAKSENQDIAKDFIKTLLSAETQASSVNSGIPVNKTAYDSLAALPAHVEEDRIYAGFAISTELGEMISLDIIWPEDEVFADLKITLETLKVASNTNTIIKEAVVDEVVRGLEAGTAVDEIVSNILKTVNLYLSE